MKIYCFECKGYTDPQHDGDRVVMNCSVCGTKYDFSRHVDKEI